MAKAYKMMRMKKDGRIYPLFVDSKTPYEIGVWLNAKEGDRSNKGKVKSRLGELAFRPGFHLSSIPYETHIGKKDKNGNIVAIHKDMVWCEVEYTDNISYQEEANRNGMHKNGKFIPRDADLDHLPINGWYEYKTNPNMYGTWIIAGGMKINRILNDKEVIDICNEHNLVPLPREVA